MMNPSHRPSLKNERGIITLDFLFAFTLVLGFSALFFALSLTLTIVEVTQYMTFAAARNFTAGHLDANSQKAVADAKFAELLNHEVFKPFYSNGWFEVATPPMVGKISDVITPYNQPAQSPNKFIGVATRFTARMLDFEIPFYGSTAPEGDGSGSGFNTIIGSYLGRDPTVAECTTFVSQRWSYIRRLPVSGASPYSSYNNDGGYVMYADNGC